MCPLLLELCMSGTVSQTLTVYTMIIESGCAHHKFVVESVVRFPSHLRCLCEFRFVNSIKVYPRIHLRFWVIYCTLHGKNRD